AAARRHIVYLHGLDTYGPAWIEIQNRETLRALAALLGARIALPRAPGRRWPRGSVASLEASLAMVDRAAEESFPKGASYGVIAFSNAAIMENEVFARCLRNRAAWILSVGGDGAVGRETPTDLSGCGTLRLIAGRYDPARPSAAVFARSLALRRADARFTEHPGGHRLPFRETYDVLRQLLGSESP
ncbi:MAG TPA: hypothetical protein VGR00_12015, partial [Thermoanaerobaculia bacterium]|nr:hypothetical protein [Thermoanaerobaculia bacterium]